MTGLRVIRSETDPWGGITVPANITADLVGVFEPDTYEWHRARRERVTASDIGTICGWNNWETRDELLARKRGELDFRPPTEATERGKFLEPAVLAWFAATRKVTYCEVKATWAHPEYPFLGCNPDAITLTGELVEAKTSKAKDPERGWGRAGTDQVPICYGAQAQMQMFILGARVCHMPVLFGDPFKFCAYRIRYDRDIAAHLLEQAQAFYAAMTAAQTKDVA